MIIVADTAALLAVFNPRDPDLADCFAVALAGDWGTNQTVTLDESGFRRLRPLADGSRDFAASASCLRTRVPDVL